MNRVSVIVVAAGEGKRFGFAKQFALIKEKSVLDWCLEKFEVHEQVTDIILVLKEKTKEERFLKRYRKIAAVARGGRKRQDSVLSGFNQINPKKTEIVLVHDGVRPLVEEDLISRVIEATRTKGAVVPAIPVKDTIKLVEGQEVSRTLDRDKLFRIQTPQGFLYSILKKALNKAKEENFYGNDEASLVERVGETVSIIQGDSKNIKITTPEDLKILEAFYES
ncbi:MAG: 2-C-methyl-D-erythritol 4-phosphate cytidylyltransferase [Candidatus Aminicenantes bacterium]|nr:2-C-methyl-D-erythritol 4-phosphate cytidylyltransferase [Candidatus Aminicenantes bacterium]